MNDSVMEAAELAEEDQAEGHQFVTFEVGSEVFAVEMAPVQEIIRLPQTVRVPLAPPMLNGLANLRGRVLPIVSLRHIFGLEDVAHDDATRAVVIRRGGSLGFVVDRVSSVVTVEPGRIESAASLGGTVRTALVKGIIKNIAGHAMVMVIDFAALIDQEFANLRHAVEQFEAGAELSGAAAIEDEEEDDLLQLVSFEVASQEYAVPIGFVQEIVQVPAEVARMPRTDSHVLGLMNLRDRLLPLVSLRSLFRLPGIALEESHRVVVVTLGTSSVGVVMDRVNEVLRVHAHESDPMPALLARGAQLKDISSICRLDGGKRLVSVIDPEVLFANPGVREAMASVEQELQGVDMNSNEAGDAGETGDDELDDELQVVVFRLAAEEFGVPIHSVQEIVRLPETLTHVPQAPSFVEGVINLRGAVLPVIDQRRRFGLASCERSDRQRIMVYLLDGQRTGFIVDSVAEVLKLPHATIETSPKLSEAQAKLIRRVANLPKAGRIIMLIEPEDLLARAEVDALSEAAA
jgi:purine-binding chemotaxis protein CheW